MQFVGTFPKDTGGLVAENPGRFVILKWKDPTVPEADESQVDVVALLCRLINEQGRRASIIGASIHLEGHILLTPRIVSATLARQDTVHTVTTIEFKGLRTRGPGTFEFQHGVENNAGTAIESGLTDWISYDLPVIADRYRRKFRECSAISIPLNRWKERVILLGPPKRVVANHSLVSEEHPFCPCCFFTALQKELLPKLPGYKPCGIRVYAGRDPDGDCSADFRFNGIDDPEMIKFAREYVRTWPGEGIDYRKQYLYTFVRYRFPKFFG